MIKSFRCKDAARLFAGQSPQRFRVFQRVAERKLTQLHAAVTLEFLRSPPGNRLEALSGDRTGRDSTAYVSMANGACASFGAMAMLTKSRSWTTTEVIE